MELPLADTVVTVASPGVSWFGMVISMHVQSVSHVLDNTMESITTESPSFSKVTSNSVSALEMVPKP